MSANILTGITAGMEVYQGIAAQHAADGQAQSMRDQIALVRAESEADIARYAEQAKDFGAKQRLAYLKSGVQLSGSPLDILDETVRVSSENISAMRAKTEAEASGIRARAAGIEAQGRAALIAGVGRATQTVTSQYGRLNGTQPSPGPTGTPYDPGPVTSQNMTNLGFGTRASRLDLGGR
jgi:hypothetical protein